MEFKLLQEAITVLLHIRIPGPQQGAYASPTFCCTHFFTHGREVGHVPEREERNRLQTQFLILYGCNFNHLLCTFYFQQETRADHSAACTEGRTSTQAKARTHTFTAPAFIISGTTESPLRARLPRAPAALTRVLVSLSYSAATRLGIPCASFLYRVPS